MDKVGPLSGYINIIGSGRGGPSEESGGGIHGFGRVIHSSHWRSGGHPGGGPTMLEDFIHVSRIHNALVREAGLTDARAISLLSRSSYVSGIILDGEIGARFWDNWNSCFQSSQRAIDSSRALIAM